MKNSDKIKWSHGEKLLEILTDLKILTFLDWFHLIMFMKYAADEQNKYLINFGVPTFSSKSTRASLWHTVKINVWISENFDINATSCQPLAYLWLYYRSVQVI